MKLIKPTIKSLLLLGFYLFHTEAFGQNVDDGPPIILSSRWFHPRHNNDTLSTLKIVDLYKPDHIDWMYCDDSSKLNLLKKRGIKYSLAINPQVPDSLEYTVKGRIVDIDGNKLRAPWMKKWSQTNPYWGCVNSPDFKKIFYEKSKSLIELGAYGLFVDDARFNDQAINFGGCYCKYCIKAFTQYLVSENFLAVNEDFSYKDYLVNKRTSSPFDKADIYVEKFKTFQHASVVHFLTAWKKAMLKYSVVPISFLTNNYQGEWNDIYQVFDIGIAELSLDSLRKDAWKKGIGQAKRMGKKQYYTLVSNNPDAYLEAILATYFAGSALIIPWDVFAPVNLSTPSRFYGSTDKFLPIYDLIRSNYLDFSKYKQINIENLTFVISGSKKILSLRIYKRDTKYMIMIVSTGNGQFKQDLTITSSKRVTSSVSIKSIYPKISTIKKVNSTQFKLSSESEVMLLEVRSEQ